MREGGRGEGLREKGEGGEGGGVSEGGGGIRENEWGEEGRG